MTEATPQIGLMHQAPAPVELDPFLGLTSTECCIDCTLERCVISSRPYCAHPYKCGLQAIDKADPVKIRHYNKARKSLALQDAMKARYE